MRRTAFLFDDGVVLCATLRALDDIGLLEPSIAGRATVADLLPDLPPTTRPTSLRSAPTSRWRASPPWLRDSPAGTARGLNVRWTLGDHRAQPS